MAEDYEDRYRFEIGSGYSTLERAGDQIHRTDPNQAFADSPYDDIFENAVHGGATDPDASQSFYVYSVEWSDQTGRPDRAELEELTDRMDAIFHGWIVDEEGRRVFALKSEAQSPRE